MATYSHADTRPLRRLATVLTTVLVAALLPILAPSAASAASVNETEPNDNRNTADAFAIGDTVSASSSTSWSYDYDWYAVDLPSAGRVSLDLRFPSNLGGDVYEVDVYSSSGASMYHFDVSALRHDGSWLRSFATYAPEGRLYIRVYGKNTWESWGKTYTLSAGFAAGSVETEFNDSRSTPDVLTVGKATSGSSLTHYSYDYDWYAIDLDAAKRMSLSLTFPSGLGAGDVYDVDVYDMNGRSLYHFDVTGNRSSGAWLADQPVSLSAGRSYVRVYGTNSWNSWGKTYSLTAKYALTKMPVPKVTGTAIVGKTLKAVPGAWAPAKVTLKYQWLRAGKAISGATKSTYKLVKTDAGKKITVKVTGSKSGYASASKTSKAVTALHALTKTPTPKITGTATVGKTLKAVPGTWAPAKVTLKYQWLRAGKAIKGATKSSYKLVSADKGKKVTVKVTGSKKNYKSVAKTSAAKTIR